MLSPVSSSDDDFGDQVLTEEGFMKASLARNDSLRQSYFHSSHPLPNDIKKRKCRACMFNASYLWVLFVVCLGLIAAGVALLVTDREEPSSSSVTAQRNNIFDTSVTDPTLHLEHESPRVRQLADILTSISNVDDLTNRSTDQHAALLWMAATDPAALDVSQVESTTIQNRYKAALFYFSLNKGERGWRQEHGFLSSKDICDWNDGGQGSVSEGIICENGNVVKIVLDMNQLDGTIPSEIALFGLRVLGLGSNSIGGTIPTELGNVESLATLRLGANRIEGSIPSELGNLFLLETMLLHDNNLTGTVPISFRSLVGLKYLFIEGTSLVGDVDSSLCSRKDSFSTFYADCSEDGSITCTCCTHCCNSLGFSCEGMV